MDTARRAVRAGGVALAAVMILDPSRWSSRCLRVQVGELAARPLVTPPQDNGFSIKVEDVTDLGSRKKSTRCPRRAVLPYRAIDGYAVEGHVPADLIDRLLAERPEIAASRCREC